jgi:hypothetical protein
MSALIMPTLAELEEKARSNEAFVRSLVSALVAVEDQLQNLDVIEEVDPSYMSKSIQEALDAP